jgi:hypothetical protein
MKIGQRLRGSNRGETVSVVIKKAFSPLFEKGKYELRNCIR